MSWMIWMSESDWIDWYGTLYRNDLMHFYTKNNSNHWVWYSLGSDT